jgi:ABC-2 type transport system permease protein
MPTFFLSGALFPLTGIPKVLVLVAAANPLSYGVDGMRGALLGGGYHFGAGVDLLVMSLVTAALLALGSYMFSRVQL